MGTLYVAKSFGRYFFFKTEAERDAYVETLPEWEKKYVQTYVSRFGKVT